MVTLNGREYPMGDEEPEVEGDPAIVRFAAATQAFSIITVELIGMQDEFLVLALERLRLPWYRPVRRGELRALLKAKAEAITAAKWRTKIASDELGAAYKQLVTA